MHDRDLNIFESYGWLYKCNVSNFLNLNTIMYLNYIQSYLDTASRSTSNYLHANVFKHQWSCASWFKVLLICHFYYWGIFWCYFIYRYSILHKRTQCLKCYNYLWFFLLVHQITWFFWLMIHLNFHKSHTIWLSTWWYLRSNKCFERKWVLVLFPQHIYARQC
jgi:hypothetical protein